MLADDRPGYPMNCFLRLRFRGELNRAALEAAAQASLARHPLLSAIVGPAARKRWQWLPVPIPSPVVRWHRGPVGDGLPPVDRIDIRREPGMRLWAVGDQDRTDLTLQLHHAACDGIGTIRFAEDLLLCYATEIGVTGIPPLEPLQPDKLRGRGRFGLNAWKFIGILGQQAVGLIGVWQFARRRPSPLASGVSPAAAETLPEAYPTTLAQALSAEETIELRRSAKALAVPLNDLLARDLFLTLEDWRRQHAPGRSRDWLRLTVPINLRTPADGDMPAANVISMVFLDRRPTDMADQQRLLQGVHDEMQQIKRLGLGLTFVLSLWAVRRWPGGLPRMARKAQCSATCLLSNLGTLLADVPLPRQDGRIVLGNAVLESIDGFGPLRPGTYAAFSAFSYAGRLCVTLHYDPRAFSAAEAGDLLDAYAKCLRQSARHTSGADILFAGESARRERRGQPKICTTTS